jgi:hypothetical protein
MIQFSNRMRVDVERTENKVSSDAPSIYWRCDAEGGLRRRVHADETAPPRRTGDEQVEEFERWDGLA